MALAGRGFPCPSCWQQQHSWVHAAPLQSAAQPRAVVRSGQAGDQHRSWAAEVDNPCAISATSLPACLAPQPFAALRGCATGLRKAETSKHSTQISSRLCKDTSRFKCNDKSKKMKHQIQQKREGKGRKHCLPLQRLCRL